jgi:hypothetical protein
MENSNLSEFSKKEYLYIATYGVSIKNNFSVKEFSLDVV